MARRATNDSRDPATIPEWERRTGIGQKKIRSAVRTGALAAYFADSKWPRIFRTDFMAWVRSTQVRPQRGDAKWAQEGDSSPALDRSEASFTIGDVGSNRRGGSE